jgi:hypothetical protein
MKRYIFKDDSYWFSNGCSCCDDYLMESFNSEQTCGNFGSAFSEEDCYLQAICTELGYEFWEDVPDEYREMEYTELKKLANEMGIVLEFTE